MPCLNQSQSYLNHNRSRLNPAWSKSPIANPLTLKLTRRDVCRHHFSMVLQPLLTVAYQYHSFSSPYVRGDTQLLQKQINFICHLRKKNYEYNKHCFSTFNNALFFGKGKKYRSTIKLLFSQTSFYQPICFLSKQCTIILHFCTKQRCSFFFLTTGLL